MAETQILSGKVVSEAVYAGLKDRIDLLKKVKPHKYHIVQSIENS